MNPKIDALKAQFNEIETAVTAIYDRASTESRDVSEDEQADIDALLNRADELKPQLERAVNDSNKLDNLAAIFGRVNGTGKEVTRSTGAPEIKTPGEFMFNFVRAQHPLGVQDQQINRSLAVASSGVAAGLLPYTIQGDIIKFVDAKRRTIDSLRYFPVPAGASFLRRVFTTGATVAAQGSENTEVSSGYPTVSYVSVSHSTYAGGIRVTLQADNFTDPNLGDVWMQDVMEQYAIKTNTVVAAALVTAASTNQPLPVSGATPATIMRALYTAADTIYNASKAEADTIWVSLATKSWLATIADTTGRPAFASVNPQNASGTVDQVGALNAGLSIPGFKVVVEPMFSGDKFIVGASKYGEVYESMYGTLSATVPSTLAREIAVAGELGTYFRSEGFVELIDTDGIVGATPNFGA